MKKAAKKRSIKTPKVFWMKGNLYIIFTVTRYIVGELVSIDDHEITLRDAAWIADTGRFSEAMRTGNCSEVEPAPDGLSIVGRGSIVDAYLWPHGPMRRMI